MSDTKPNADALAKQLKDSLAQRRPRPWKAVLATMVACAVLLVLIAWWLYPKPRPSPLQIMAFDTVCTTEETPLARALLIAPADEGPRRMSGHSVVFHEQRLMLPAGVKPREINTKSDARGLASTDWPLTDVALAEFLVLHVDPEQRVGSLHERGRIFVWPKDAPLLLVDVDETLLADELDAQASKVLTKAAKDGWHVVYLSVDSAQPHEFRKRRAWVETARLPLGPVLGRQHFSETSEHARGEILQSLQSRFKGPIIAVVKSAEAARINSDSGGRTIQIGSATAPTWADVTLTTK